MKKLTTIAALAAVIAGLSVPQTASAITVTPGTGGPITVKWNNAVTATLTLTNNYSATGTSQTSAPTVTTNANTGSGTCVGPASEVASTVNFGTVTTDAVQATGCRYNNAINAAVATNSINWSLTQALSAVPANSLVCAFANGFVYGTAAFANAGGTANVHQSAVTAAAGATCAAAGAANLSAAASTIASSTTSYTAASPAELGEDLQIILASNAATGAQAPTLTYTLTAN